MEQLKFQQPMSKPQAYAIECGNCWGHQEWNGTISNKSKKRTDKTLDGFIVKFINKYLRR